MTEKKQEAFGDRILNLRKILRSQDWKDDGVFRIPSRPDGGYTYLTAEKTKKQFNEALIEAGISMSVQYSELSKHEAIGNMSQHWTVKCTMRLYGDAEYIDYVAYGEAGDSGDKGVNKAQTDAFKQIIFNQFLVADCSDPDANTDDIEVPSVGRAIPKTAEQRQAVKEKLSQSQVIAKAPEKPQEAPKVEPKAEIPTEAPKPQEAVSEVPVKANAIQQKAIANILYKAVEEKEQGTITDGDLAVIQLEAEKALGDPKLASQFIIKHRRA